VLARSESLAVMSYSTEDVEVSVKNTFLDFQTGEVSACRDACRSRTSPPGLAAPLHTLLKSHRACLTSIEEPDENTFLMLRNVPHWMSEDEMVKVVDNLGFSGTYDYLHFPKSRQGSTLAGFGFVNFLSDAHALDFIQAVKEARLFPRKGMRLRATHHKVNAALRICGGGQGAASASVTA